VRVASYDESVASSSRDSSLAKDAIEVVLRRLGALPASPEVEELREKAEDYLKQVQGWQHSKPTAEEREELMKRVLKLHVEVAKIERSVPGT
jgi:hypothetical protein